MSKYGILAWPAYATKANNPYNYLIYKEIEKSGYPVFEFDFNWRNVLKHSFSNKYKIFHIHWPSNILSYSTYQQASRRLILFHLFLIIIKIFRKKIIWTVHNLQAHESDHPRLQMKLDQILYQYVDGFISLNKKGLEQIQTKTSKKGTQKFKYIPHPHYQNYYDNNISKERAREILGIPKDKFVFLFIGQIRRYKNITGLIDAFNQLKNDKKFLLIAGNVHHEIKNEISQKVTAAKHILFHESFVKDADLQLYLNCSDLVVTPYSNIFNSGSVFLNMSFYKPTLAPEIGIFPELREQAGKSLIKLYKDTLSDKNLEDAMLEVIEDTQLIKETDLSMFDPQKIALETITFYNSLLD